MDDEIEKQVERALAAFNKLKVPASWDDELVPIFRDLLAGKFKEDPVPEIVGLAQELRFTGTLHETYDGERWYVMAECGDLKARGPYRPTKAEAVMAWNAALSKRDER